MTSDSKKPMKSSKGKKNDDCCPDLSKGKVIRVKKKISALEKIKEKKRAKAKVSRDLEISKLNKAEKIFEKSNKIIVYDSNCPKCRLISKLIRFLDVKREISFLSIRDEDTIMLLKKIYGGKAPFNYHYFNKRKGIYGYGIQVLPFILWDVFMAILFPYKKPT